VHTYSIRVYQSTEVGCSSAGVPDPICRLRRDCGRFRAWKQGTSNVNLAGSNAFVEVFAMAQCVGWC
jgi:hypothetical protein